MYNDLSESNKETIQPEFVSTGGPALSSGMILCEDYKLEEQIGQGGMGQIWRAQEISGKREVAIKFVPQEIQHSTEEMARVERMFELMHTLHHEHICPMYSMKDGGPGIGTFLVMQFITGMSLNRYFEEAKSTADALPLSRVAEILRPIASALDYAHTRRPPVIHRDVKPSNILVYPGENDSVEDVQLIDFGLAETFRTSLSRISTVENEIIGTREYMAPEQWMGQYQNAATDQYALAVTAYELLAGHLPFESSDFGILKDCVLNQCPPEIPELPASVNAALQKALSKQREERFASCTDFIAALSSENQMKTINSTKKFNPFSSSVVIIPGIIFLIAIVFMGIGKFMSSESSMVPEEPSNAAPQQMPPLDAVSEEPSNAAPQQMLPPDAVPEGPSKVAPQQMQTPNEANEKDFLQSLAVQFAQDKWLGEQTEEIMVCADPQKLNLNSLDFVSIINNNIDDEVLTWFTALPNLKKITFSGCENITEVGWLQLKSLTKLETLVFYNCKNFTEQDLAMLQEALPNCEIQVK